MNILCYFDGHSFQPVADSATHATMTEFIDNRIVDGPSAAVAFKKRCKRCGYEHSECLKLHGVPGTELMDRCREGVQA